MNCIKTFLLAFFVLLILSASHGQPAPAYEPFKPTEEWGRYMGELYNTSTRSQGVVHMCELAARERGRTIGAKALFMAGSYCEDKTLYRQLLSQVVSEYPNSLFAIEAQIGLMNLTTAPSKDAFYASRNQFLASLGCPTLDEIYRNRRAAVQKMRGRSVEVKRATVSVYEGISHLLYKSDKYREAIAVCQFGKEWAAAGSIPVSFNAELGLSIDELSGRSGPYQVLYRKPEVDIRSPKPGHKCGSRPHIRFDIRTGDYRYAQPWHPVITLDGQNLTPEFELQSKYDLKSRTGPNKYFVQQRYSFRPSTALAPGRHTVRVQVDIHPKETAYKTDVTWEFFVQPGSNDGPDDDDLGPNDD